MLNAQFTTQFACPVQCVNLLIVGLFLVDAAYSEEKNSDLMVCNSAQVIMKLVLFTHELLVFLPPIIYNLIKTHPLLASISLSKV